MEYSDLNPLLHQPVRTKIMAYLIDVHEADFTTLKKVLDLSDGHMTTHMSKLVEAKYIEVTKEFLNNKPKTTYTVTKTGKKEFIAYLNELRKLIDN